MGRRSESRSSRDRGSRRPQAFEEEGTSIEGVELTFVCKGVPVLTMDKASIFHENASWILQSALSSTSKADALFEYCDDREVIQECRRLGLRDEEISLVRLRQRDLRHVKAVGTTGKRAVMLAVVVALALEDGHEMGDLWKELRDYDLYSPFVKLLHRGRQTLPPAVNEREEDEEIMAALEDEGVEMQLIRENVPVIGLAKESIFQENASWLLQTATGSSGRADLIYEYCSDREVVAECRTLGLTPQEVGLARLKSEGLRSVKAIGTCGKRSIMLSLVVAMVMREQVSPLSLLREVAEYDSQLEGPVQVLLRAALRAVGKSLQALRPPKRREEHGWRDWGGQAWGGKRKWEPGEERQDNGRAWSKEPSKKRNGVKLGLVEGPNAKSLDKQLDEYWGDED